MYNTIYNMVVVGFKLNVYKKFPCMNLGIDTYST